MVSALKVSSLLPSTKGFLSGSDWLDSLLLTTPEQEATKTYTVPIRIWRSAGLGTELILYNCRMSRPVGPSFI